MSAFRLLVGLVGSARLNPELWDGVGPDGGQPGRLLASTNKFLAWTDNSVDGVKAT